MIKKIGVYFLMLATFSLMTSAETFAQKQIRFAKGRSSATISGTLQAGSTTTFVVRAKAGQIARVSVNNRRLKIFSDAAPKGESGSSSFDTNSGNNEFGLDNPTNRAINFTMTISIR
jgi:hypothetical protein